MLKLIIKCLNKLFEVRTEWLAKVWIWILAYFGAILMTYKIKHTSTWNSQAFSSEHLLSSYPCLTCHNGTLIHTLRWNYLTVINWMDVCTQLKMTLHKRFCGGKNCKKELSLRTIICKGSRSILLWRPLFFSLFFLKVYSISSTNIGQPMKKVVTKF